MIKATIELTDGRKMNLELLPEYAPISVENFVSLAKSGFYEGLCFHRVIDGFMIQGGGMKMTEYGLEQKKAPKTIKGEFIQNGVNNTLHHAPGVLSMARTMVPDSASSQFFICVADCGFLDGQYAGFGKIADEESMKVAVEIGKVETGRIDYFSDVPLEPIVIKSVTVTED